MGNAKSKNSRYDSYTVKGPPSRSNSDPLTINSYLTNSTSRTKKGLRIKKQSKKSKKNKNGKSHDENSSIYVPSTSSSSITFYERENRKKMANSNIAIIPENIKINNRTSSSSLRNSNSNTINYKKSMPQLPNIKTTPIRNSISTQTPTIQDYTPTPIQKQNDYIKKQSSSESNYQSQSQSQSQNPKIKKLIPMPSTLEINRLSKVLMDELSLPVDSRNFISSLTNSQKWDLIQEHLYSKSNDSAEMCCISYTQQLKENPFDKNIISNIATALHLHMSSDIIDKFLNYGGLQLLLKNLRNLEEDDR